jgi:hypothetical protein
MNFNEIRTMGKDLGINTYRKKKTELIHTIQEAEDKIVCYGTERVEYCNEGACLRRNECISLNLRRPV